jgi:hypothetical protein
MHNELTPAAHVEQAQIYSSTHTTHVTQIAAPDYATAHTSKSKQTRTMTKTTLVTIAMGKPMPTSSSLLPALSNCISVGWPADNAIIPHIHGIVPRSPLPSHSPPSTSSRTPTITTIAASALTQQRPLNALSPTTFRTSGYPRPSPPRFLYPGTVRIVSQHSMPSQARTDATNPIWYLPYNLRILIITFTLMGLAWAVLVRLVKFPLRTWSCKSGAAKKKGKKKIG